MRADHGYLWPAGGGGYCPDQRLFRQGGGGGHATAINLYMAGTITAAQATICIMPSMLMGTLVGHYARIVLVTETNKKYSLLMIGVALFDAALGMLLMRVILTVMGLM